MLHLTLLTLILKIQSLQRHDIWEMAQAGQKANKGQDKGRIWAMIMQSPLMNMPTVALTAETLSADVCNPCTACACVAAQFDPQIMHVLTLLHSHWQVAHIKRLNPHQGYKCVSICLWTSPAWTTKKSINRSVRGTGPRDQCPSPQGLTCQSVGAITMLQISFKSPAVMQQLTR